jgi:hypothetical protein
LTLILGSCSDGGAPSAAVTGVDPSSHESDALTDRDVEPFRRELIDLASQTAGLLPSNPHIKTNARLQAQVVQACLDLNLAAKGASLAAKIPNWRRGLAYADLACLCAEQKLPTLAKEYGERAMHVLASISEEDSMQEWRGDRIKSRVARMQILSGEVEQAKKLEEGLSSSEVGRNAQVFSSTPSEQLFKDSRPSFLHAIETAPLDQLENLLPAQTKLYSGLYSNETSREQIADDILLAIKRLPVAVRLASLEELALAAFQNADKKESERWTRASSELISKAGGTAEHRIPSLARLAAVKFQTGQHKEATANLANAIALFDLERHTIIEIDRAEVLIAVAEALTTMGEADRANAIYERALTEAGINPNSRPRAEDLVAILCSMAVHSPHMSSDLREKAQALFASLGHPW